MHIISLIAHLEQVPTRPDASCYAVDLKSISGDADLYISTASEHPTMRDHMWFNVDLGLSSITLHLETPLRPFIYIAVHGYAEETEFQLHVSPGKATPPAIVGSTPSS